MVYFIPLIIAIICSINRKRMTPVLVNFFFYGICAYITILMGLRYRVGIDTLNYIESYKLAPNNFTELFQINYDKTTYAIGYQFLTMLCRQVTHDFWFFQLVQAFIVNTCVFIFIKRYCKNIFIGVTLYLYLMWLYFNTEIMRESLAIAIFLLDYNNLEKRKYVKYYLISLISFSFHYSAAIVWLIPFVRYLKFNIWYVTICILIIFSMPYAELLNSYISISAVNAHIGFYLNHASDVNINYRIAQWIQYLTIPLFTFYLYHKYHYTSRFSHLILLHFLICVGVFTIPVIFTRFLNYTILFVIVYTANLLSKLQFHKSMLYLMIIVIICSQIYYYTGMYRRWFPYESIFTEKTIYEREQLYYDYNKVR